MALNNNSKYLEMHTQDDYIVFKVQVKNVSVLPVFCWLPAASPHSRLSFLLASLSALVGKRFKVRNVILSKEISNWNTNINIYINIYDYYKYHQSIFILINKIQINEYKIDMDQILNWVDCNIWVALPWVRSFPSCN